ncbi:hypothetical protein CBF23_004960 [Marinomonas agarivorans]|nr:hypothetical protein CBF23_004960 [Marinomonas agarivorans]
MKNKALFSISVFILPAVFSVPLSAQDNDVNSKFDPNSSLSAYEAYIRGQKADFDRYKEEHEKFLSALQQEWQDYKAMKGFVRDEAPKLPSAPVRKNSVVRPIEQPHQTPKVVEAITPSTAETPFVAHEPVSVRPSKVRPSLPKTAKPLPETSAELPEISAELPATQVGIPTTEIGIGEGETPSLSTKNPIANRTQNEKAAPSLKETPLIAEHPLVEKKPLAASSSNTEQQQSNKETEKQEETSVADQQEQGFLFYGQQILLSPLPKVTLAGRSEKALHNYWAANAQANYEPILTSLQRLKKELALSDWALYLLTQAYIKQHWQDENQVIAASWFLLNNLGYEARIANGDTSLILMMTARQTLFGMPYYPIDGKRYYHLAGAVSKNIRSYAGEFSRRNVPLNMSFDKTLKTVASIQYRNVKTRLNNGQEVILKLPYDLQRVNYLATYPQLDLRYYFSAPVDPVTAKGLQSQIPNLLVGSKDKQVSQLLHLIHESFPYAVDKQQFGYENYLTVEESLHYQASDCEDRSVLFAWLAKNLLQEPVVALEYEGHVATALTRDGRLVSADPTYIGANLGDIMPNFSGVQPKVIRF